MAVSGTVACPESWTSCLVKALKVAPWWRSGVCVKRVDAWEVLTYAPAAASAQELATKWAEQEESQPRGLKCGMVLSQLWWQWDHCPGRSRAAHTGIWAMRTSLQIGAASPSAEDWLCTVNSPWDLSHSRLRQVKLKRKLLCFINTGCGSLSHYLENSKERRLYLHFGQDTQFITSRLGHFDVTFPFLFFLEFYLFIFGCAWSLLLCGLFLPRGGILSSCCVWVSYRSGFSCRAQALGRAGPSGNTWAQ